MEGEGEGQLDGSDSEHIEIATKDEAIAAISPSPQSHDFETRDGIGIPGATYTGQHHLQNDPDSNNNDNDDYESDDSSSSSSSNEILKKTGIVNVEVGSYYYCDCDTVYVIVTHLPPQFTKNGRYKVIDLFESNKRLVFKDSLTPIEDPKILSKAKKMYKKYQQKMESQDIENSGNDDSNDNDDDDEDEMIIDKRRPKSGVNFEVQDASPSTHENILRNKSDKSDKYTLCRICAVILCFAWMAMFILAGYIVVLNGNAEIEESKEYANGATKEVCYLTDVDTRQCDGTYEKYYFVGISDKCNTTELDRRNDDAKCGGTYFELNTAYICYVLDCDQQEFSFINFNPEMKSGEETVDTGVDLIIIGCIPVLLIPISLLIYKYRRKLGCK